MTAAGKLSGKAKSAVKDRVLADLQVQKDVELRLLFLENQCYKAGLKIPLCKIHVKDFLLAEESTYNEQLKQLIAVELNRQTESEEIMRKQLIKEAAVVVDEIDCTVSAKVENDNHVCTGEPPSLSVKRESDFQDSPSNGSDNIYDARMAAAETVKKPVAQAGKVTHVMMARFEITVPVQVAAERVRARLEKKIVEAGITSLKELKVVVISEAA